MNSIKRLKNKILKRSVMVLLVVIMLIFNCFLVKADTKNRIYHIGDEIEVDLDCWIGWKDIHFGIVSVATKRGDTIRIKASDTIKGGVLHTDNYDDIITKGYGYYSIDFRNHMIGLLNAISKKISNRKVEDIIDEEGNKVGEKWLHEYLTDAMTNIVANNYSYKYETGDFVNFWTKCIQSGIISESELKKVQNDFYYKAYCESAFDVLTNMMKGTYTKLTTEQKQILKGVVFSVMEARYRNKNVNGKMNLAIKASEGEVWPFLVKLKNLNNIIYDKEANKYKDEKVGSYNYYEWPTFDEMIDGVYQWMYYVESDMSGDNANNIKKDTIMIAVNSSMEEGDDIDIDWEGEYYKLTWQDIPNMGTKDLSKFYSDVSKVKSLFKKNSENTEGIFGVEESYTIESTINYSDAIVNMKKGIEKFCTEVGGDVETIFNGLNDNNMERTYLMAKNIVASNKGIEEYAYYDIGTNIITHTPGEDGNYYLLVDFQKVELDTPIRYYDGERMVWSDDDKDIDGILDRDELGSRTKDDKERINILPFVRKMIEKELYGEDDESIRSVEGQLIINSALATMKYNVYKEREDFYNAHINDNIQDRKEIASNYLNVDDITRNKILAIEANTIKTDVQKEAEIRSMLSGNNAKLEVTLWNYESNPDLIDTDFDGIDDGYGYDDSDNPIKVHNSVINDKNPKNNHFKGKMNSTRLSGDDGIEVEMNMDYRYFLMSNKLYYDELSTMSLLMANSIYKRGANQDEHSGIEIEDDNNKVNGEYKNLYIRGLMKFYGFKDIEVYYMGNKEDQGYDKEIDDEYDEDNIDGYKCIGYSDTHKGAIAIGHRNVEYHGISKEVVGIVCRGTAEDDDWDNDFDLGDLKLRDNILGLAKHKLDYDSKYNDELRHFSDGYKDWSHKYHHAGFDIVANREFEVLEDYLIRYDSNMDANMCYWITGHSMGAAVANLIAAHLINEEQDNVYCYTFAAPNNFYMTDNYDTVTGIYMKDGTKKEIKYQVREPKASKYRCIFNIVNSDDFVIKVPMNECGWTRYGQVAEKSFSGDIKIADNIDINTKSKNHYITSYSTNVFLINKIVECFSDMFEDKNNMRNETYEWSDGYVMYANEKQLYKGLAYYAQPYQKYDKRLISGDCIQYQMPAFVMQNVANAVHELAPYRNEDTYKFEEKNGKKFREQISKMSEIGGLLKIKENEDVIYNAIMCNVRNFYAKWSVLVSQGLFKVIDNPHYLETYYILTKNIDITDFK